MTPEPVRLGRLPFRSDPGQHEEARVTGRRCHAMDEECRVWFCVRIGKDAVVQGLKPSLSMSSELAQNSEF